MKMADRITVMSWLEGLAQDDWRMFHSDSEVQEIAQSALAILKEQEAVEPVNPLSPAWGNIYFCGKCGYPVGKHNNYCSECGKKVKWK